MNERDIFLAAIEIDDPNRRQDYVDQACGADDSLRADVQALLDNHARSSEFLETPAAAGQPEVAETILSDAGRVDDSATRQDVTVAFCKYLEPSTRDGWLGRLAHYEVEEILGSGAFGIVAKAFDEKLHRVVAIKMLSPELATTSPPRKRFLREARSAAAVPHENLVGIYAVEDEPIPYLVMEYVAGETLQARLDRTGPLDVSDILRIGCQIAAGMAAAHAANLIHRDIKPSNILLSSSPIDKAKISDFGMARAVDDASMTRSGMIAGTPMYMAPEQARGETLDHRADLFSLGSVLYQMSCGRPPFRAANTMAVLKRVCEDRHRPIADVLPGTPEWLCAIIDRLLEKKRDDRFQSAQEVTDLLACCQRELETQGKVTCVDELTPRIAEQEASAATSQSSGGRLGLLAIGAFAIAALVIGWVIQSNRERNASLPSTDTEPQKAMAAVSQPDVITLTNKEYFQTLLDLGADVSMMYLDNLLTPKTAPAFEQISENAWRLLDANPLGDGQQYVRHLSVFIQFGSEFDDQKLKQVCTLLRRRPHDSSGVMLRLPCEKLTSKGLSELADLKLIDLQLWHVKLDAEGIANLKRCLPTDILVLNAADLDNDEFIDLIQDVPQGLWLHVTSNQITDEALGTIHQAAPRVLNVSHNKITDEGLKALYDLESLEQLQLEGTQVTSEGLAALHPTIPSCTIHWNGEIIEPIMVNGKYQWPEDEPAPAIAPFTADEAKQHQEKWAEHLGVPVEYENSIGMKFRLIPPGEFLMGSTQDEIEAVLEVTDDKKRWLEAIKSESPQHRVVLTQPFYIGVSECLQTHYEQIMGVNPSHFSANGGGSNAVAKLDTGNHPVETVSWNDAAEFCANLNQSEMLQPFYSRSGETITPQEGTGYRLPTEAEWDYACRAGATMRFEAGNADEGLKQVGWYAGNSAGRTHSAGEMPPNRFGLFDTLGNVWEWVQDSWDPTSYQLFQRQVAIDPSRPFWRVDLKVMRGAGLYDESHICRSSIRGLSGSGGRAAYLGFRVALEIDAVKQRLDKTVPPTSIEQSRDSRLLQPVSLPRVRRNHSI